MHGHRFKFILLEDLRDNLEFILRLSRKAILAVTIFHRLRYKFVKPIPTVRFIFHNKYVAIFKCLINLLKMFFDEVQRTILCV